MGICCNTKCLCVPAYPRVYLPQMWRRKTRAMNTRLRISTGTGPLMRCRERRRGVDMRDRDQNLNAFYKEWVVCACGKESVTVWCHFTDEQLKCT